MPSESPPASDLVDAVDALSAAAESNEHVRPPDILDHIDAASRCGRAEEEDDGGGSAAAAEQGNLRCGDVKDIETDSAAGGDVDASADVAVVTDDVGNDVSQSPAGSHATEVVRGDDPGESEVPERVAPDDSGALSWASRSNSTANSEEHTSKVGDKKPSMSATDIGGVDKAEDSDHMDVKGSRAGDVVSEGDDGPGASKLSRVMAPDRTGEGPEVPGQGLSPVVESTVEQGEEGGDTVPEKRTLADGPCLDYDSHSPEKVAVTVKDMDTPVARFQATGPVTSSGTTGASDFMSTSVSEVNTSCSPGISRVDSAVTGVTPESETSQNKSTLAVEVQVHPHSDSLTSDNTSVCTTHPEDSTGSSVTRDKDHGVRETSASTQGCSSLESTVALSEDTEVPPPVVVTSDANESERQATAGSSVPGGTVPAVARDQSVRAASPDQQGLVAGAISLSPPAEPHTKPAASSTNNTASCMATASESSQAPTWVAPSVAPSSEQNSEPTSDLTSELMQKPTLEPNSEITREQISGPTSEPTSPLITSAGTSVPASAWSATSSSAPDSMSGSAPVADGDGAAVSGSSQMDGEVRLRPPDLNAVPTRSNLKRKNQEPAVGSDAKRSRRCIQFDGVTVFYFPRAQGFTCIPSQGGSTLGMANAHSHVEKFTLSDHVNEQRAAHRQLLARLRLKQRKLLPSASSSEESDVASEEGSDVSDSELDVDSYFFLRPVTTRQRRAMLRASGVRKIEPLERDECRDIRTSREFCGCACKVVCRPEHCQCAGAGIKCQVDRQNFPCGCTREGCRNPTGRVEFNPARVRSHFVETIMREQPPASSAAGVWASCGWQKAEGCPPAPQQPYMVEQDLPAGYQPAAAAFPDLAPPYQEDSYSENSDASRDSYDTASAASRPHPPPVVYPPAAQTQSHYSSFSFEGGLQNFAASPVPPPPQQQQQQYAAPLTGYQQAFPACQAYSGGHAYPAPHYSYPFNKYPPSGPGPGGGGASTYPAVRPAPPAVAYPSPCAVAGGVSGQGPAAPTSSVGYPVVCYPPYAGSAGSVAGQPDCSYAAPPPVYATAGPYDASSCTFRAPPTAGATGGYSGFPSTPAAATSAPGEQERKYTDLRSVPVPATGQLGSLTDLLQNKFTSWPAGGAAVSAPAATAAPYCGTPQSEDSGVDVDECAAKHAISPPADESIGEILKKSMVESVSA